MAEETGVEGDPVGKLGDVRYVYTWDGERIFKVVSFFLFRYRRGRIGDIPARTGTRWPRRAGFRSRTRRACSPTRASGRWPRKR